METFFANRGAYVVLAFAALAIPAAAAGMAYLWYKFRRDEMLIALKHELVARGMSAEEIRAVIEASPAGTTSVAQDLAAFNGCSDSGQSSSQPRPQSRIVANKPTASAAADSAGAETLIQEPKVLDSARQ